MIKSTCAYFNSDSLYFVRPSVTTIQDNHVIFNYCENDIDICYLKDGNLYGLIKDKKYFGEEFESSNVNIFDQDKISLLKYLFESTYNVECNDMMLNNLLEMKPYYEIDELIDLYDKIIENDQKIKKLK